MAKVYRLGTTSWNRRVLMCLILLLAQRTDRVHHHRLHSVGDKKLSSSVGDDDAFQKVSKEDGTKQRGH